MERESPFHAICAMYLNVGNINETTNFAESQGGSGSDTKHWGGEKDEDEIETSLIVTPSPQPHHPDSMPQTGFTIIRTQPHPLHGSPRPADSSCIQRATYRYAS